MDKQQPTSNMVGFMPSVGCATQPRLLGDGMDSESLKKKLPMPRMSSIGRHTNLTSSDKLASVTKSQKVRFVAREPVRAAVKPLTVDAVKPGGRHMVGDPHTVQHSNPSCSVNMVAPIVSRTCDSVCGTSTVVSMNGGAMPRSAVEGELSAGSGGHQMPSQGVREVEGQSDSPTDLVKLQEEKTKLEEQLHFQNTINTDLKKLLVASVGDDLHYKVESLIRTKATLACEIGDYTKKIYEDYENLDQLSIQADMWRSKFMANKVLIEKLNGDLRRQEHRWTMAEQALRQLLEERQELNSRMVDTHRYLKLLRDSFDATITSRPPTQIADLLQLSRVNQVLADAIKLRLLGSVPLLQTALDAGIENGLTPAEKLACQVMVTLKVLSEAEVAATGSKSGATVAGTLDTFARFHPNVNYDNITLQCCSRCKGDLQVV